MRDISWNMCYDKSNVTQQLAVKHHCYCMLHAVSVVLAVSCVFYSIVLSLTWHEMSILWCIMLGNMCMPMMIQQSRFPLPLSHKTPQIGIESLSNREKNLARLKIVTKEELAGMGRQSYHVVAHDGCGMECGCTK
jgi:hypothetical protein